MNFYSILYYSGGDEQCVQSDMQWAMKNLDDLLTSNLALKALLVQQTILVKNLKHREVCLSDLYGDNWRQAIACENSDSPQRRAYREEIRQLAVIKDRLLACNAFYEERFEVLRRRYRELKNYKKNSQAITPLNSPLCDKISDRWPEHYWPDLTELILLRHLAKNKMGHIGEAYVLLIKTLQSSSSFTVLSGLQMLHNWLIQNAVYAGIFAASLQQLYAIIMGNADIFGHSVVKKAQSFTKAPSIEILVNNLINEKSEALAVPADFCLSPCLLALLHLAQIAPWLLSVEGNNVQRYELKLKGLFTTIIQDSSLAQQAVVLVLALLKPCHQIDSKGGHGVYQQNRVILHVLLRGMAVNGGLVERRKVIQNYLLKRQALKRIETLAHRSFRETKPSLWCSWRLKLKQALRWINPKLRSHWTIFVCVSVSIAALAAAWLGATPDGSMTVRVLGMECGGLVALGIIWIKVDKIAQSSTLRCQRVAADLIGEKKSRLRIQSALKALEKKVLCEGCMDKRRLNVPLVGNTLLTDQLINAMTGIEEDGSQASIFSAVLVEYAAVQKQALLEAYTRSRQQLIHYAQKEILDTGITRDELNQLVTELDIALMLDSA